jgi:hypothetical protein
LGEVEAKNATEPEGGDPVEDPNVTIPVENYLPDDAPTFYSDAMIVVHSANEFVVSFLQTEFPLAVGKEELQKVNLLRRKCVARIIMSPAQFEATTEALQTNLKKYHDSHRKQPVE